MSSIPRLVPRTVGGLQDQVSVPVVPVYAVSEFGKDVTWFPGLRGQAGISDSFQTWRPLLTRDQMQYAGNLEQSATAGATSTLDDAWQALMDYPAILSTLEPFVMSRLVVGAGNTVTLACQVQVGIRTSAPGEPTKTVYDETITVTGLTADEERNFWFGPKGIQEIVKAHGRVRLRIVLTATRTAGASNTQVFLRLSRTDAFFTRLSAHVHPAINHANEVLGMVTAG